MSSVLGFLNGVILAAMISLNGELTSVWDVFVATVLIHLVGCVTALVYRHLEGSRARMWGHRPAWVYLGGVLGVGTTLLQCLAVLSLSLTSVVALGLLGQILCSLAIDLFGLLGAERARPRPTVLVSLAFALVGIWMMLGAGAGSALAIAGALGSGACIVASRTTNARLSELTDVPTSTLLNFVTALPVALVVAALATTPEALVSTAARASGLAPWVYAGGVLSVAVIAIYNVVVPRLPSVSLTLLVFSGQVVAGLVVDVVLGGALDASVAGSLVVTAGIALASVLDLVRARQASN